MVLNKKLGVRKEKSPDKQGFKLNEKNSLVKKEYLKLGKLIRLEKF